MKKRAEERRPSAESASASPDAESSGRESDLEKERDRRHSPSRGRTPSDRGHEHRSMTPDAPTPSETPPRRRRRQNITPEERTPSPGHNQRRHDSPADSSPAAHRRPSRSRTPETLRSCTPGTLRQGEQEAHDSNRLQPSEILPAQRRTGQPSSLCWKYFQKLVIGKRRTKKGNEVDNVVGRCKLCRVKYTPTTPPPSGQAEADGGSCYSPPQYQTPQGSTKTLLTHILREHLKEGEDHGGVVDPEDVPVFLATGSATKFAPHDIYEDFVATTKQQEGERAFDNTRFQLNVLRWLVISQQPFLEAESEALQCSYDECNAQARLKSRSSYHRLLLKVLELERQKLRDLLC
jgi:hypothetical protein